MASTLASATAYAQGDTLRLFQNATSQKPQDGNASISQTATQETDTIGERLSTLADLYFAGKYLDVLDLSRQIDEQHHLSKSQNLIRLKYTIAAYKELDYHHEADSAAQLYWQKDPFYVRYDPVPFQEVMDNYYTKPKFSVWVAAGKTIAKPRLQTVHSIVDTLQRKPDYDIQGFTVQLGFEYRPLKIFSVSIAPAYTSYTTERTTQRTPLATFRYEENLKIFSLPLFAEASAFFGKEKFVPSAYFGVQIKYLTRSEYRAYTDAIGKYVEIPDYTDNIDLKKRVNYSLLGGIRLNYYLRRIIFFADFGISADKLSINDPKKKYSNGDLLYQNLHIPDKYRMLEYTIKGGIKVNLQYKTIAKYNYGHNQ